MNGEPELVQVPRVATPRFSVGYAFNRKMEIDGMRGYKCSI
jgi:hypothetical protein